jgi:hypothetical protein
VDLVEQAGTFTKRHPWEVARAEFFLRLLSRRGLLDTGTNWLDVGAGDAWFAGQLRRLLSPAANLTCWDINYSQKDLATRGEEGMIFVADRPTDRFDRVIMLDVIEHVDEDVDFVHGIVNDLLAEDAVVLVSVPANPALFSSHDRTLSHCRRYSPGECRRLLQGSGLSVIAEGGLFHSLLPLRVGQVLLERIRPPRSPSDGIGNWQAGAATTRAITRALITDGRLSLALSQRGISLPGLSYWALCSAS